MLLDLVHQNSLHGIAVELFGRLLNHISHILVSGADTNLAHGSLEGILSCKDNIGLATSDGTLTNNDRGCSVGGVTIKVGTTDAAQAQDDHIKDHS